MYNEILRGGTNTLSIDDKKANRQPTKINPAKSHGSEKSSQTKINPAKSRSPEKSSPTKINSAKSHASEKSSPTKVNPAMSLCPYSKKCGGCSMIDVPYEEQLERKNAKLKELYRGIYVPDAIVPSPEVLHYRNKVTTSFARNAKGEIISGIYEEGTRRVIRTSGCLIENIKADAIIATIRDLAKSFKITIYNDISGNGLLRHALVRVGVGTGEIMVVLVVTSPIFPSKSNFVKALRREHPEITTIVLNINDADTGMVLGSRNVTIFGSGFIFDELCGLRFRLSPGTFYQVNSAQTVRLYSTAIELAHMKPGETLIDAYCGVGTIGLVVASSSSALEAGRNSDAASGINVIGIELNRDAVRDANANAKHNHIENAHFYAGDAGEFLAKQADNSLLTGSGIDTDLISDGACCIKIDAVIMDPPRSGASVKFLDSLAQANVQRVVYISCNPETQVRDLKYLCEKGYKIKAVKPFDMFANTEHVESVVLLSKVKE